MFVFPEPLGPTMAVTPPSNWISVCRAKVLKPSNCRDLRNKLAPRVADGGVIAPLDHYLVDGLAELPASRFGIHRLRFGRPGRVERDYLGGGGFGRRGFFVVSVRARRRPWG